MNAVIASWATRFVHSCTTNLSPQHVEQSTRASLERYAQFILYSFMKELIRDEIVGSWTFCNSIAVLSNGTSIGESGAASKVHVQEGAFDSDDEADDGAEDDTVSSSFCFVVLLTC